MATQMATPKVNGFAVMMEQDEAIQTLSSVPKITESGTDAARQGVSMADMIAQQVRDGIAAAMGELIKAQAPAVVPVQAVAETPKASKGRGKTVQVAHHGKGTSNPRMEAPKAEDTRPWYTQALTRANKKTGERFYAIDPKSIMTHGDAVICCSNKWAPALLLLKGRRKPIYLNAGTLAALADSAMMLSAFAKANHEYLARSIESDDED